MDQIKAPFLGLAILGASAKRLKLGQHYYHSYPSVDVYINESPPPWSLCLHESGKFSRHMISRFHLYYYYCIPMYSNVLHIPDVKLLNSS